MCAPQPLGAARADICSDLCSLVVAGCRWVLSCSRSRTATNTLRKPLRCSKTGRLRSIVSDYLISPEREQADGVLLVLRRIRFRLRCKAARLQGQIGAHGLASRASRIVDSCCLPLQTVSMTVCAQWIQHCRKRVPLAATGHCCVCVCVCGPAVQMRPHIAQLQRCFLKVTPTFDCIDAIS